MKLVVRSPYLVVTGVCMAIGFSPEAHAAHRVPQSNLPQRVSANASNVLVLEQSSQPTVKKQGRGSVENVVPAFPNTVYPKSSSGNGGFYRVSWYGDQLRYWVNRFVSILQWAGARIHYIWYLGDKSCKIGYSTKEGRYVECEITWYGTIK